MLTILENDRNIILYSLSELDKKVNSQSAAEHEGRVALAEVKKEKEQLGRKEQHNSKYDNERTERIFDYAEVLESKVNDKDEEIRLLRSLASAGIITAGAAHELSGLRNHMSVRMRQFDKLLAQHLNRNEFSQVPASRNPFLRIEQMADSDSKIVSWLDYALMPLKRDRRTRKKVNVANYLNNLAEIWSPLLASRKITLILNTDKITEKTFARLFPIDLDTVFNNLIINSMEAFVYRKSMHERHITIRASVDNANIMIDYKDNAGGLDESFLADPEQIFRPHTTTKVDSLGQPTGTGMGMYLIKAVLDDNGASITLKPELKDGFCVEVGLIGGEA